MGDFVSESVKVQPPKIDHNPFSRSGLICKCMKARKLLQLAVASLSDLNILLSTLLSHSVNLRFSLSLRDQISDCIK